MGCPTGCGGGGRNAVDGYIWTASDGESTIEYPTLIMVKAKVLRSGGTYKPKPPG